MICKNSTYIIKDSNNTTFKFELDLNKNLNVEQYVEDSSNKLTIKNSVIDYSVDIDSFDRIHLAFVTSDGILKYCLFNYPNSEKALTGVKTKSFELLNITLKIVSNDVHIFYMLKNKLNDNKCNLYHGWIKDSSFSIKNIGYTSLKEKATPYSIDIYKNNLYLFYSSVTPNEYCIEKLNLSFNMWSTVEKKLSLLNAVDAEFTINNMGTGIVFFNHYSNKNTTTFTKFKDFNNLNNPWSDSILIKSDNYDTSLPSIVYKNNICFIFWIDNSSLYFKKSSYGTNKWSPEKTVPITENFFTGKYIKYVLNEIECKNNYLYLTDSLPPYSILNHKTFKQIDNVEFEDLQHKFNPLNGPLNETLKIISKNTGINLPTNTPDVSTNELSFSNQSMIEKLQEELYKSESKILSLEESLKENNATIEGLKNNIASDKDQISSLNTNLVETENYKKVIEKQELELKDLSLSLVTKTNEIEDLKSTLNLKELEVNNLVSSYKNLSSEKDIIIEKLNNKIIKLQQSIDENKNKGFFNLFK